MWHTGIDVAVVWTNESRARLSPPQHRRRRDLQATSQPRTDDEQAVRGQPVRSIPDRYVRDRGDLHRLLLGDPWAQAPTLDNGGSTRLAAQTIASNAAGSWPASVAASGSTALFGYAIATSTDDWTVVRRSINKGSSWGSVVSLSPASGYRSFQPAITYRGGFRVVFERCLSSSCATSNVYYRSSSTGVTWTTAIAAGVRKRSYESPADVDVAPEC